MKLAATVLFIFFLFFLGGCASEAVEPPAAAVTHPASATAPMQQLPVLPTATPELTAVAASSSEMVPRPSATLEPTTTAAAADTAVPTHTASPPPSPTASDVATADRAFAVAAELAQAVPPARDNERLAVAFRGLDWAAINEAPAGLMEVYSPGMVHTFKVLDVVNNTYGEIEAELYAVGDHAYFWFESGPFGSVPADETLASVVPAFDDIYERVTGIFGQENTPGIDGDPRLHILHASPQTICGVAPDGEGGCGTAGFVSSSDLQPATLNPQSNQREMFVMNDRQFGSDYYLGVLAHELRHLVEFNYDISDTDWEKEGSAVLAAELVDLPSGAVDRANEFLKNPDQQLNSWTELGKGPYYGQGYLFNQYLYDRLGEELYREFATSPLPGFVALNSLAEMHNLDFTGESLWLDWLAALVLHAYPQTEEKYRLDLDGLESAEMIQGSDFSAGLAGEVRQFAADYYELPRASTVLQFAGSPAVSLLQGQDGGDVTFWYAQRANASNPRLTRSVDLSGVETATLVYDVYADIEQGYDFAYVSASTDGGTTWHPLSAANMQGLDPADDPSGSALAPRFYTGRAQEWRHEIIDLTPFAGQEILLRFEMVTDPILTYSGLAVDNVGVPEIGYFDEDSLEGWSAEGFTLAASSLPQPWHLQLIEFTVDGPVVSQILVKGDGTAEFAVEGEEGQAPPVLIIAASAPMTLVPAEYQLAVNNKK